MNSTLFRYRDLEFRNRDDHLSLPFFYLASSQGKHLQTIVARTLLIPYSVSGESIQPIQKRNPEAPPDEIGKGLEYLKKRESLKMAKKKRVLLRSYLSQPIEELRNNRDRHEIGMGIFWVVLAAVCGSLGWVLLTILLK